MQEERITITQALLLIVGLRLTFSFLTISTNTPPANQDVWIALLLSLFYAALFFAPLLYLSIKFPNKSLTDYAEKAVGKILGKSIILLYVGFLLFLSVLNTVNITIFIGSSLIPETSQYIILLFMIIPSMYAAHKGIINIVKAGQILFPVILFFLLFTSILGVELFNLKTLLPIFKDSSLWEINTGGITYALCFHDALLLFFMAPYLQDKKIIKVFMPALFMSTFFFVLVSLAPLMSLGIEQAKHANYPFYMFLRQIKVFDFIERIEALTLAGWIMVELFKVSVYIYFASTSLNQVIQTKSYRKFIIPFAGLIAIISSSSNAYAIDMINLLTSIIVFPKVSLLFVFVIPLFLSTVIFIKKILAE